MTQAGAVATVGIWPSTELRARDRLFDGLSRLTGLTFVPVPGDRIDPELAAVVAFTSGDAGRELPATQLPMLVVDRGDGNSRRDRIRFADSDHLDQRLRSAEIPSDWAVQRLEGSDDSETLASVGGTPVWTRRRDGLLETVLADVPELARGEWLRDRVTPGRCLGMLALLQFLRRAGRDEWLSPPLHACFIIDDPNLHWRTYGHIDFAEVADHAERCNYHVSFATIPFDLALFDRRAVRLFQKAAKRLSLTIHGNNHAARELGSPATIADADRLLAQALRRTARFEARTALDVSRVMVPPHEVCARRVMTELPRLGFEAVALTRANNWQERPIETSPYGVDGDPVAGFAPAEVTEFGTPVLIRRDFAAREEVVLRGFLGQPVVLYGHPSDFRDGLGFLADAADCVNQLAGIVWSDLATLARSCYRTRRVGDTLHIRPFSRRVDVPVAPGVERVVVEPLMAGGTMPMHHWFAATSETAVVSDAARTTVTMKSPVPELQVQLSASASLDPYRIRGPIAGAGTLARRLATEARDRAQPIGRRLARMPAGTGRKRDGGSSVGQMA